MLPHLIFLVNPLSCQEAHATPPLLSCKCYHTPSNDTDYTSPLIIKERKKNDHIHGGNVVAKRESFWSRRHNSSPKGATTIRKALKNH